MNIFDLTRGVFDLTATRTQPVVILPAPKFTAQPQAVTLYQRGGKVEILGANTDTATAYQWQKQGAGGAWADVSGRTGKTLSKASGVAADAGVYRLKAVNGNSAPAYSNSVYVYDSFLFMQNDVSNDPAGTGVIPGADKYHWIEDGPAGLRYYSAFLRFAADQTLPDGTLIAADTVLSNTDSAKLGFASGRMVAAWTSTNAAVTTNLSTASNGQAVTRLAAGSATLSAKFQNLQSDIAITVA